MPVDQDGCYLKDAWRVSSGLLVKIGLRSDKFTNQNNLEPAFIKKTTHGRRASA